MKTRARFLPASIVAGAVALAAAVGRSESEVKAAFVDPMSAEAASYRSAGSYAIDRLIMTMVTDCAGPVAHGTEVAALPTLHLKDVPMKDGTVAGLARITAMKLTSLKLRNPANAPDEAERLALAKIQTEIEGGVPPKILVQTVETPAGTREWRVYKPLVNIRQCGNCHGRASDQSPELRAALQEKYSKDEAIGYLPGEWRGVIRVTVADPPVVPAAAPTATKKK